MKRFLLLIPILLLLTACSDTAPAETNSPSSQDSAETSQSVTSSEEASSEETSSQETPQSSSSTDESIEESSSEEEIIDEITTAPTTNAELFAYFLQEWKKGDVSNLYQYTSTIIKSMFDEEAFQYMFCGNLPTFGKIKNVDNVKMEGNDSQVTYFGTLHFENAKADFQLHLENLQIAGYYYDLRFEKPFDVKVSSNVTEHYFLLESGDYLLNAVYVEVQEEDAPVVLMIPGSGPSDYNETTGILPTFQDLAGKLADNGISSLRFEKRTIRYASDLKTTDGLNEEYFDDLDAAISWITKKAPNSELWYLGHSLGVNIAAELCSRHPTTGLILWNGSARHLADIIADQYGAQAIATAEFYQQMANSVKKITSENASGTNYFACSDYYWASYNKLDTIASIKKAKIPTLILNSRLDRQLFDADRELWQAQLGNNEYVRIHVFDDQSHFGYPIDAKTANYYQLAEFPDDLIYEIATFMLK